MAEGQEEGKAEEEQMDRNVQLKRAGIAQSV
jgi:hypothetical protein